MLAGPVSRTFMQSSFAFYGLPEAAVDFISGVTIKDIGLDVRGKFGCSKSNRTWDTVQLISFERRTNNKQTTNNATDDIKRNSTFYIVFSVAHIETCVFGIWNCNINNIIFLTWNGDKKTHTNCGTKAADVLYKF